MEDCTHVRMRSSQKVGGYVLQETKASTFPLKSDKVTLGKPKEHHLDDLAIQAWGDVRTAGFQ